MKKAFLILGSGATAGGFETEDKSNLPTDQQFFESAVVNQWFSQETFPALHFFASRQSSKSLEKTWSDVDLASKLTNNQITKQRVISMKHDYKGLEKFFQKKALNDSHFRNNLDSQLSWVGKGGCMGPLAAWEAVQLVSKVYEKIKEKKSTFRKVLKCILGNTDLKGIATFNYDYSVESIWHKVSTENKLYYYDPDNSSGYMAGIPYYKMHGSINWCSTFDGNKEPRLRWHYEIPNSIKALQISQEFEQGKFLDGIPDHIKEPTVIPPDLFKQNITLDIQNDAKSVLFKRIWHKVWEELENVEVLIFIGFSFPDTDHHAKFLFATANRRKPFRRVIVNYNNNKETTKRYESIFNKGKIKFVSGGIQGLISKKTTFISYLK